ncbi:MAG: peptidase S10 [Candidatus Eremiobacteraeota bacterium]|nr:peptidase S10 [Candidatus Eremiobacteraeota bacterium]
MLTMRNFKLLIISVFIITVFFVPAKAYPAQDGQRNNNSFIKKELKLKGFSQKEISISHHVIMIDEKPLKFTAITGYMPIRDEKEKVKAKIFFISYIKDGVKDPANRPVTFAFNGGPGSSSIWLHFGALGPKRVKLTDKGELPPPPYKFIDNDYTWLAFTDLVFIDPVDTGYSRAADKKDLKEYFGVMEDVKSVGEFIRLYVSIFKRWRSPKYIAGESYGAIRAAGLADYLQGRMGMHLNGIIMVSQALNYSAFITGSGGSDIAYALHLPSFASTAFYHHRLPPELQKDLKTTLTEVENWAINEYLPIMAKGNSLPQNEREKAAERIARYTGLSKSFVLNSNLRVKPHRFRKELLKGEKRILGYYDGRLKGVDPVPEDTFWPEHDPTFFLGGPFSTAVNDYIRNSLKFVNDLPYNLFSGKAGRSWNYKSGISPQVGSLDESKRLSRAMNNNSYLKVFVACGYYDLCTPYFSSIYTVNQLKIDTTRIKNIKFGYYNGGHMFYTNVDALVKFRKDMNRFYRESSNVIEKDLQYEKDRK